MVLLTAAAANETAFKGSKDPRKYVAKCIKAAIVNETQSSSSPGWLKLFARPWDNCWHQKSHQNGHIPSHLAPDAGKLTFQAVLKKCIGGNPITPAGSQTCPHQTQHFIVHNVSNQQWYRLQI